jgi:hypothetical protein
VFPFDSLDVEPLVQELIVAGLLTEYEAEGKKFLHIKGFLSHQKVEKKSTARFPIYEESAKLPEPSPTSSGSSLGRGRVREGKRKKNARARASPPAAAETHPPGLDAASWERWRDYRQSIGKALKPASLTAAMDEFAKLGTAEQQAAAVQHSIANGWTGLFAPKAAVTGHASANGYRPSRPAAELIAEAEARGEDVWALPGEPGYAGPAA